MMRSFCKCSLINLGYGDGGGRKEMVLMARETERVVDENERKTKV